ncbi:acyl-CoA dehydratase activase [candidate division NPL-UPA2 bacterium]|nr:acyl-CoA dehydratase activase [candidate division NPL-UPA2 bacterium]
MKGYLGIDVGSVTTKMVILNEENEVITHNYLRTEGNPVKAVQEGLKDVEERVDPLTRIQAVGTTGSGRYLAGVLVGADTIKNEITAHAVAAICFIPEAQTVFEIGGQDSKIIIIRDEVVVDFAMNTVCAAGTGSFLDHQAARLNLPIEKFGEYALQARHPVRIAGRCTVFAESDMVHKQQTGHNREDIIAGLCQALVYNYLNNVAKGKELLSPFLFQGGVAANQGIKAAFERELESKVIVPPHHVVMGAIGAAILAREEISSKGEKTRFKGFEIAGADYRTSSFECGDCANLCEVVQISLGDKPISRWGSRCRKWEL